MTAQGRKLLGQSSFMLIRVHRKHVGMSYSVYYSVTVRHINSEVKGWDNMT